MAFGGKWLAALGAGVLIVTVGYTGWSVVHPQEAACVTAIPKAVAESKAFVWSPPDGFTLNGKLCVAWKPKSYFAAEVAAAADLKTAWDTAQGEVEKAQKALDDVKAKPAAADYTTQLPAKTTALATVIATRNTAKGKHDAALSAIIPVALFIDGTRTPITFPARADDETDAWVWRELPVSVPANAADEAARTWRKVLSGVTDHGDRKVRIGLGDSTAELPRKGAEADGVAFHIFRPGRLLFGGLGLLALMWGLVTWDKPAALLRDRPPSAEDPTPPYSLARTQMAFWFALTLAGFLFVWLISGQNIGVLTATVATLIGISGASGVAAVVVDANPDPTKPKSQSSGRFFQDILSDGGGKIVLHRVQMLGWTLVMGAIFVWTVVWTYAFPEFDSALLVLAGIVGTTYVGFKTAES